VSGKVHSEEPVRCNARFVMKHIAIKKPDDEFKVVAGTERSQAAVMVIAPGESEGGPDNKHEGADQWLFVLSGEGEATVDEHEQRLSPGSLLLIEAGETHEIRNTGREPLRTINFYAPPEY
jgi:mannose-6-phosphate isomerase-like protein (cupin superfamily)